MSPELDEKIVKSYPILFRNRHASPQQTCMCWGFECGDGWYDLINEASAALEAINAKCTEKDGYIVAAQVKEKFGGLRFYLEGHPSRFGKEVDEIISTAMNKSESTCEQCGKLGRINTAGWWRCVCDDCGSKR